MSRPFAPRDGGTTVIAASTTSAHGALVSGCHSLRIVNASNGVAFVKTAQAASLTATTADFPVLPGQSAIMNLKSNHNRVGIVLSSGAGNVYVTPGAGGSDS
jgi:hypothetical protein